MRKTLLLFCLIIFAVLNFSGIVHVNSSFVYPEEEKITYSGSVTAIIEEDGVTLYSSTMMVFKENGKWEKIEAREPVRVETKDISADSQRLIYYLSKKTGKLISDVVAVLEGRDSTVTTDLLEFDLDKGKYWSDKPTTVKRKDVTMNGEDFSYTKDASLLEYGKNFSAVKEGSNTAKIYGDSAAVDLEKEIMEVSKNVRLVTEDSTISANSMEYDLKNSGKLFGYVRGLIDREGSLTRFESDILTFDIEKEIYEGVTKSSTCVKIWKDKTYIEAGRFVYRRKEGFLELYDRIFIWDRKKDVKMWAKRAIMYLDEEKMKAWDVRTEIEVK
ncbi:MAG: hypothetical protein J7L34_04840 [Thermotogaceae bacterium]|nr:hypothetical protein [Thermotogaceae bacterium]